MADINYGVPDIGSRHLKQFKIHNKGKTSIWNRVSRILYPVSGILYTVSRIPYQKK